MPGNDFAAPDHVRLSYGVATEDIVRALDRIGTYLKSTGTGVHHG